MPPPPGRQKLCPILAALLSAGTSAALDLLFFCLSAVAVPTMLWETGWGWRQQGGAAGLESILLGRWTQTWSSSVPFACVLRVPAACRMRFSERSCWGLLSPGPCLHHACWYSLEQLTVVHRDTSSLESLCLFRPHWKKNLDTAGITGDVDPGVAWWPQNVTDTIYSNVQQALNILRAPKRSLPSPWARFPCPQAACSSFH